MRRLLLLLLSLPLVPIHLSAQQGDGVRLELRYKAEYQPGFVVLPVTSAAGTGDAAAQIQTIVRRDLEYSDRFQLRDPSGAEPGKPANLRLWKERGADWVLESSLQPRAGGLEMRVVLHDVVYGRVRQDTVLQLPAMSSPDFRMAVHRASDAVVFWATGEPGMAASRIAFVLRGRGSKEVYVVDSDGENVRRVTTDGSIALSPTWSPEGSQLAYTSFREGTPMLYERELRSGSERVLSSRPGLNITPAYAPNGRTVAFATTAEGNTEVALHDGGRIQVLTRGRMFDSLSPTFSPDGSRFAFVSNRLGDPHLYVMSPGGEPRLLTPYAYGKRSYNTSPDWSPRGPWIAYHTRLDGRHQLALIREDGEAARLLTSEGNNEDPSWAPDGRHLVFSSPDREGGGLFILDTVSGRVRTLLRGPGYGLPDWSPRLP